MDSLENLKGLIAGLFDNASSKDEIDRISVVKQAVEQIETEHKQLLDRNAELLKSYKDIVQHQTYKVDSYHNVDEPITTDNLDFADSVLKDLL